MAELVLALDIAEPDRGLRLVDGLEGIRWVKVGPILATSGGPRVLAALRDRGLRVFLDLKWHDIPNTVAGAVAAARAARVSMVTVHALGGPAMIGAAKQAAGADVSVVAVTVLTSHTVASWSEVVGTAARHVDAEVDRLARLSVGAGADGVVCSPKEAGSVRSTLGPGPLLVTPGIRSDADATGDQARTANAREAVKAGATHLVVGRPVVEAADPVAAWADLLALVRS